MRFGGGADRSRDDVIRCRPLGKPDFVGKPYETRKTAAFVEKVKPLVTSYLRYTQITWHQSC